MTTSAEKIHLRVEAARLRVLQRGEMKLDEYFEAYDQTYHLAGQTPEWSALRRRVRRALARPVLELTGQVAFLAACLALGMWGHRIGYLLALGTLCFLPQYIDGLRAQIAGLRGLSSEEELHRQLAKEAQRRMAGAVVALFLHGGLGLLFLATAALAGWLGKDFRPGLGAGLVLGGLCCHTIFVRLPRASRELSALDDRKKSMERKGGSHGE